MDRQDDASQPRAGATSWGVFAGSLFVMLMAFVVAFGGELGWLILFGWIMLGAATLTAVVFHLFFTIALKGSSRTRAIWQAALGTGVVAPAVFNLLSLPSYLDGTVLTLGLLASIFGVWIPLVAVAAIVTAEERSQQQPDEGEKQPK